MQLGNIIIGASRAQEMRDKRKEQEFERQIRQAQLENLLKEAAFREKEFAANQDWRTKQSGFEQQRLDLSKADQDFRQSPWAMLQQAGATGLGSGLSHLLTRGLEYIAPGPNADLERRKLELDTKLTERQIANVGRGGAGRALSMTDLALAAAGGDPAKALALLNRGGDKGKSEPIDITEVQERYKLAFPNRSIPTLRDPEGSTWGGLFGGSRPDVSRMLAELENAGVGLNFKSTFMNDQQQFNDAVGSLDPILNAPNNVEKAKMRLLRGNAGVPLTLDAFRKSR